MSKNACEALIVSANLPNLLVAFQIPNGGLPFCGGIFRIEYLRPATDEDRAKFKELPADKCPLCDQEEVF